MSDHPDTRTSQASDSECHNHIVPASLLVGVLVTSLALTWITVEAGRYDLGGYEVQIGLAIATVQATLVALFFMGLLWESPFHGIILVGTLIFAAIFLALCMIDTHDYETTLDPTSPRVQEKLDQGRQSLSNPDF